MKKLGKWVKYIYFTALAGMCLILLLIGFTKTAPQKQVTHDHFKQIDEDWYLDEACTTPVDIYNLKNYMDEDAKMLSV